MNDFEIPVFNYQLKNNLEQLTDLVEKLPGILPDEIKQNSEAAFNDLKFQIEKSKKYLEAFHKDLDTFSLKACELYDNAYKVIKEKKEDTDDRMEDLANLKEIKCNIPYNFKEFIDIAERLGKLTDEQFGRVIDLAKAFSGHSNL